MMYDRIAHKPLGDNAMDRLYGPRQTCKPIVPIVLTMTLDEIGITPEQHAAVSAWVDS